MFQMLSRKNFQMCFCYVQMSMMSKCPRYPNVYDVVTLVTCGQPCHMWSHLSHVVTIVTGGHTCHMWSHVSHMVTIVTCSHTCHKKPMFQLLTKK